MSARRLALAGVVAVLAGCDTVDTLRIPTPPPVPPTATTVAPLPDLTGASVPTVAGRTTTTAPAIGPGAATVAGVVTGPNGPVGAATVQVTRIVGGTGVTVDVMTGADGRFSLPRVLGGDYRIRAWQAPVLALTTPQLLFVGASDTTSLNLQLTAYTTATLSASTAPALVGQGGIVDVAVLLQSQQVGADGVVRSLPVAGQPVEITGGGWQPDAADPVVTGADGSASLQLTCVEVGASPLTISGPGGVSVTAAGTTCVPAAPVTTTTTPTSTTTLPGAADGGSPPSSSP